MCVFMLEDPAGSLETVVFPETFARHGTLAENDAMVVVRGKFEKDDESARLVATEVGSGCCHAKDRRLRRHPGSRRDASSPGGWRPVP